MRFDTPIQSEPNSTREDLHLTDVSRIGVVVIGRNEGERLKRCLRSLAGRVEQMIYVDSGSTDGSVEFAKSMGVHVIDLDMSKPFTMARGRNAGWQYLAAQDHPVEFVQFVDGDCEVAPGWIESAFETIANDENIIAVCGRRRERFPEASMYNALTDMEWDHTPGEVKACGGDVMMRLDAIAAVNGFNESMIAGEEAELCVRMRRNGGRVMRIDAEMTFHDAAMTRFSQWWKRAVRGGHAYAEGAMMHGKSPDRHNVRQVRSVVMYAGVLLILILMAAIVSLVWTPWAWIICALLLAVYPVLAARIFWHRRKRGNTARDALIYSVFCVLGKFAEMRGVLTYWMNHLRGKHTGLLEYKQTNTNANASSAVAD